MNRFFGWAHGAAQGPVCPNARLVDLRLGEGCVGAKDYLFAQSLLALNRRQ